DPCRHSRAHHRILNFVRNPLSFGESHRKLTMDLVPLIDRLGEPGTAVLGGAIVALVFGFLAQRSAFCTRSAVLDLTRGRDLRALATWIAGFAAALLSVQLLLLYGELDVVETRFFSTAQSL